MSRAFDPERWRRVQLLLDALEGMPTDEHEEYLASVCSEPELRREALSLLAAESEGSGFLDRFAEGLGLVLDPAETPDPRGQRIGAYQLQRQLGEGGMGVVYEAEQLQPLRRTVALKVIKLGMDTSEVLGRFETERQALALMDHPSIARVFEAGATEDGRPFFAMEYVPGLAITQFCDRHRLSIQERIELFGVVCDAVQHAHRKGIIHRDLKPSNILVAQSDGKPVPKVIDFGVAKATDHRLAQRTAFTQLGHLIGTPEYMSPEQAQLDGVDIDTRTDVYSLGVVLYELLVGALPFDPDGLRQLGFEALLRRLREDEPPKPSTRASTLGDSAETAARNRRAEPRELARRLRGELDWIVMKAVDKDRARRYQTASELAADLDRFRRNEPVLAGPPSTAYRLRKLVRRHRWGVAAATIVALSVLAGVVATVWQSRVATAGWSQASEEAERAERVTEFLLGLFEASNPDEAVGETITAQQLLERGVERTHELDDEPEVQAQMLAVMGRAYQRLGVYAAAQPLLDRTLAIRQQALGLQHPLVAESLNQLGTLQRDRGDYQNAERTLSDSLALRRQLFGEEHEDVAATLVDLGRVHQALGDYQRSEELYRRSLAVREKVHGGDHEKTAISVNDLAVILWYQSDYEAAEPLLRRSLATTRRVKGENHPAYASVLGNLALVLQDKGDLDAAEATFRETIALDRRLLGDVHPGLANDLHNFSDLLRLRGEHREAEALSRDAVRIGRAALGEQHPNVAAYLVGLARVLLAAGECEQAEPQLVEALEIQHQTLPATSRRMAGTKSLLGACLTELRRYQEAEQLLLEAHRVLETEQTPATVDTAERLVSLYVAWGKPDRAARYRALEGPAEASAAPVAGSEPAGRPQKGS